MLPKHVQTKNPNKSLSPENIARFKAIKEAQRSLCDSRESINSISSISIKRPYLAGKNKYVNSVVELKRAYKNYKTGQDKKDTLLTL